MTSVWAAGGSCPWRRASRDITVMHAAIPLTTRFVERMRGYLCDQPKTLFFSSQPKNQSRMKSFRCQAGKVEFSKYQGLGNDFILVSRQMKSVYGVVVRCCLKKRNGLKVLAPCCDLVCPQVDNRRQAEPIISAEQAIKVCDRNFGVGGDGVRSRLPQQSQQSKSALVRDQCCSTSLQGAGECSI